MEFKEAIKAYAKMMGVSESEAKQDAEATIKMWMTTEGMTREFAEASWIEEQEDAYEVLKAICISRRCYLKGEELDLMKASSLFIEDFRSGRLGKITLELMQEEE